MTKTRNLMELMIEEFGRNDKLQMLLKYTSNQTLIVPADMDSNSKFVRRSRRRLNADEFYYFDGIIQNGRIIYGTEVLLDSPHEGVCYRTKSDTKKNDYYLFVSEQYEMLKDIQKRTYDSVRKERETQITMNSLTKPNQDREMTLCGFYEDDKFWFCASSPLFRKGDSEYFTSTEYDNDIQRPYLGQYKGVLYGLKTALKYADKLDKIYIYADPSLKNSKGVYALPLGQWRPFNDECKAYIRCMKELKEKLAAEGISIIFKNGIQQQKKVCKGV